MIERAAIGVFDSGIGGLTVARAIAQRLPDEDIIYLGDTARLPYGTKSAATVARYAERAVELLTRYPVKTIVIACNTATAHALEALRAAHPMPILGVIEPGARAALAAARGGPIAIAGTEATVRSTAYQRALRTLSPALSERDLLARPWPLLVPLAEEGWVDHPVTRLTISTYLADIVAARADTLILGCTHYPVFKDVIRDVLATDFGGYPLRLVDSADSVTDELAALLTERSMLAPPREGRRSFFCTDAPERFARVGEVFFGAPVTAVSAVDL
jgi:glutamate racemase